MWWILDLENLRPVNHDIDGVGGERVADKRVMKYQRFLTAGVLMDGWSVRRRRYTARRAALRCCRT